MVAFMVTVAGAVVAGLIVGAIARLLLPGRQNISLGATVLIGFLAALVGGLIAQFLGVGDTDGIDWIKLFIQIGLAMIGIGFWSGTFFRTQD
ncbi:MAG: GlsB/YeaQ/YmgE family stress response membrane protein [Acidimicrobiia bacterium]|nr:GlsB/YeaQ/YmgE family stress response membrane protein [Acidimicrobiia bacterium]